MPRSPGRTGRAWRALVRQVRREEDTCCLCHRLIDFDAEPCTRWSFSVEHITPLSKGGHPLTRDNVHAAHFGCNSARGNRDVPPTAAPFVTSRAW
jgi:5-methylcytosine-specific restriction endonuclease McrA